jgi:hypothetical protein
MMARSVASSRYGNCQAIAIVQESSHLDPRDDEPRLQQHVIRGAQRNVGLRGNTPTN